MTESDRFLVLTHDLLSLLDKEEECVLTTKEIEVERKKLKQEINKKIDEIEKLVDGGRNGDK